MFFNVSITLIRAIKALQPSVFNTLLCANSLELDQSAAVRIVNKIHYAFETMYAENARNSL